jgi:hypothetical protein
MSTSSRGRSVDKSHDRYEYSGAVEELRPSRQTRSPNLGADLCAAVLARTRPSGEA